MTASSPIYLDNNAGTLLHPCVLQAMREELENGPSNPSSVHSWGQRAKARLANARQAVALAFGVHSHQVFFTSSCTEALNWIVHHYASLCGEIVASPIEHDALWQPLQAFQKRGGQLTLLPIDKEGRLDLSAVAASLTKKPVCLICMAANNETGVKSPIIEIAALAEAANVPLIVDASAWIGKETFPIHPGMECVLFSPHKFHGPRGVGVLLCHHPERLTPLLLGGGQEFGLRAGTENLPAIIGAAAALSLLPTLTKESARVATLRDRFEEKLVAAYPSAFCIGKSADRICNTSQIALPPHHGQRLLAQLDLRGVAASHGAACSSATLQPSRVLREMGLSEEIARSALRFSLSSLTTEQEVDEAARILLALINPYGV